MCLLSKFKITHQLLIVGILAIAITLILSAGFMYNLHLEDKLHKKEVAMFDLFEVVWDIQIDAEELRAASDQYIKTRKESDFVVFKEHRDHLSEDIYKIRMFFKDDEKAREMAGNIEKVIEEYGQGVKTVVDTYLSLGLVGDVNNYMSTNKAISDRLYEYDFSYESLVLWNYMQRKETVFFYEEDPKFLENYYENGNSLKSLMQENLATDGQAEIVLRLINDHAQRFLDIENALAVVAIEKSKLKEQYIIYSHLVESLKEYADSFSKIYRNEIESEQKSLTILFYIIVFSSLFVFIITLVLVIRNIRRTTGSVVDLMSRVSSGNIDLSDRLPINGEDEMADVAQHFNVLMDKLESTMTTVSESSCHLVEVALSAQKRRDETSGVLEEQVACVHSISELMEGVNQQSSLVTDDAKQAAESANTARDNSQAGAVVVSDLIESMNNLATSIEGTSQSVIELDEHGKSIHGVITMIQQIAEQTNLLALNAAIEAARAGESGRGFAVVADEVRSLSMRTKEATEEINSIITVLQGATKTVVDAMHKNQDYAASGVDLAKKADGSLQSIIDSVASIGQLNEKMLGSVIQNQQASASILANFEPVKNAINDITSSAKQSISDGADLTQTAAMMQAITASYGMDADCEVGICELYESGVDEEDVELF